MVSAADPRAAAAGVEILRKGGSATDAAIATMLALNVVEPQSAGIGGGAFFVRHDARSGATTTIDGREAAPKAADPRWFYRPDGTPLSHEEAVPGGRSVGVPGTLRAMALAHLDGGRLPWAALFQPAIRLARGGWTLSPRFAKLLSQYAGFIDADAAKVFLDAGGNPHPAGARVTNPEQAALFERIARAGPEAFYGGAQARKLVATVNGAARNPSRMTLADLAGYRAKPRPPVCGRYRVYRVCSMGPPSSGGVTVLMILKQLERFDMAALGPRSPVAWHLFAESSRLAYADRDLYVGDPDFVHVPVAGLLDPAYLASRSALISADRAMERAAAGTPPGAPARLRVPPGEAAGTTDLVVADRAGNVVEVTTTIESVFGSGLSMDGTMLNNELTDFDIVPEKDGFLAANRVEGGKRPRSSMAPTIVYGPDGKVRIALGAAGGSTIIAQVAKALVATLDWKMSAQDAIALGLLYSPGDTALLEKGTTLEGLAPALRALGHRVQVVPLGLKANAVERVNGRWVGAADPRSEGVGMSESGEVTAIVRAGAGERPPE
ncbi:MAG: gamma-glutamyltransferase [Alphaproteobacteria bacterium]|nr:gamma-glutamyltransferase [Alphaproteobacteria bacterium]MBV9372134.1 gamma-glutamyltransferase [Alphaproteobacteria bacterium]MBV9901886.1 gamma-glutamyltransferase [Alphaproteobacteria bacterium]